VEPNACNLDEECFGSWLRIAQRVRKESSASTASTLVSPTSYTFGKADLNKGNVVSNPSHLTDYYRNACKDFCGMPTEGPCIYESCPDWAEPTCPQAQSSYTREARPVYGHDIASSWIRIGTDIVICLDSRGIRWTSIDPVAFANAGEKVPFCQLMLWMRML
jgi:hypothetical protein